jgi:hypothetical protein
MSQLQNEIEQGQARQDATPEGLATSLLVVNSLQYKMPSNMSVCVSRNMKRSFANLESYREGGKIIVTWNTGSEFVYGPNGYLVFDIEVEGSGATGVVQGSFGSGSACNVIDNVTVTSVQGTEVDRNEGVNVYVRDMDRYKYSQDWLNNFGSIMGYASTETGASVGPVLTTSPQRFCIPLSKLCGMCNSKVLIPSTLAGGLRFEIKLASANTALKDISTLTSTLSNYKLTNVNMHLDTYQLADSIQKRLMMESASRGLEYYYETYDRTRHNITSSNKANITVRKSVARALSAHAKTRLNANVTDKNEDSMESEVNKVSSFFWRLGALNFPNQRLNGLDEQYYYAQYSMGKVDQPFKNNSVSLADFKDKEGLVCVTLERSNVIDGSGLPVNNSRQLQVEIDYGEDSQTRDIDVYMNYLQLARVFVNNVLVKQ